jgi:hypothetical protein
MDTEVPTPDDWGMTFKPPKRGRRLFLGEWLDRLGRKPVDLADAVGVGESYISNLVNHRKKNPSSALMLDISEFLGIAVNDLYRPPPPRTAIESTRQLDPAQLAILSRLLDDMNKR